jgi:hypothetical protein
MQNNQYKLIIIVFTSFLFPVFLVNIVSQAYSSSEASSIQLAQSPEPQPTTKVPLGTKQGLEELKALLDSSEATNSPVKRQVVVFIPKGLPEFAVYREAGALAIREFFLIADKASLNLDDPNPVSVDLESPEGSKALLPNGGSIRLRIRKIKEGKNMKSVGEIRIQNHGVAGYERVNEIEFVTQQQ